MVEVSRNKSVFTINVNGLHTTVKIQKDLTLGAKNPIMAKTFLRHHCIKVAIHQEEVIIPNFMYLTNLAQNI